MPSAAQKLLKYVYVVQKKIGEAYATEVIYRQFGKLP